MVWLESKERDYVMTTPFGGGGLPSRPSFGGGGLPSRPQFTPIGVGNRTDKGLRINLDKAHGVYPVHVDVVKRLPGIGAHKIRIGSDGEILSDELT
jgi:hypothetical protein